jgi:predicted AlkP superfamily phosphohydrolase/phosphomutase
MNIITELETITCKFMPSKTLLVGLDGAEPDLLFEWAKQGSLPNLKKILDQWFNCPIDVAAGFGDGVFWTSLITGAGVSEHGRYFPKQYNPHTYELDDFSIDTGLGREPFWYYCSKAGARVACIDMYTAPLRTGLNGIQVADWMTHSANDPPRSSPISLIKNLTETHMPDPFAGKCEIKDKDSEAEYLQTHEDIVKRLNAKTDACSEMLSTNDWDIFCVGYCDPHDISHQSWHWHDKNSPAHPSQWRAKHGDPILKVYQELDVCIGKLMNHAKAENIFLVAGLGMTSQTPFNSVIQKVLGHYCGLHGSRRELTEQRAAMPYFELPHNMSSAAIRVNLKGRDARGVVDNDDYSNCCNQLAEKLLTLQDAESNKPIVKEVVKVHEIHQGKLQNNLPDLFVVWEKQCFSKSVRVDADTVFDLEQDFGPEQRTGDHSDRALFMSNIEYAEESIQLEAIAPTICRTLGINLPGTDAEPIERTH